MKLTNITEIKALLARHGFHFSKALGQNFLVADWVPRQIAESAELDSDTGVLEIGPGIGCLTAELSQRAGKVLAVELDKSLEPVLAETLEGRDNVELLFGDVLRLDLPSCRSCLRSGSVTLSGFASTVTSASTRTLPFALSASKISISRSVP